MPIEVNRDLENENGLIVRQARYPEKDLEMTVKFPEEAVEEGRAVKDFFVLMIDEIFSVY